MATTPCSLLVVDDEPAILATLSALLRDEFEVLTAETAAAAEEIMASRRVDLILADQLMPGKTGVDLLEWVHEQSPQTIRLLMTGINDFDITVRAVNRGQVFRIILKPWRTDELILILQNAARAFHLERNHEELLYDLHRLNGELEERVKLRTHELEQSVHQLQQRNSMLEKLSLTDALTGLLNRRATDRISEAEIRRRGRHPAPLALGLIDADHFKEINSNYLLPGGDQVLVHLGQVLDGVLRLEDTVGRIGGEEFQVIAPQTDEKGATVLAERLRAMVESVPTQYQGNLIPITVSVGFAVAELDVPATYAQMKELAAAALEEAKTLGRNRCVVRALAAVESHA